MKYRAYWLHEGGDLVPVQTIHITEVIREPGRFGYTMDRIIKLYNHWKEPVGFEGKAREAIMADLIRNNGWIRVRYQPAEDFWIIELHSLNEQVTGLLATFFKDPEVQGGRSLAILRITELFLEGGPRQIWSTVDLIGAETV